MFYIMKLMSNTATSYPMGAGRFKPWLFVNCCPVAVDEEPRLETSCTHWIGSCSIAHQFHVVSTNAAMSLYGINVPHVDCASYGGAKFASLRLGQTKQTAQTNVSTKKCTIHQGVTIHTTNND